MFLRYFFPSMATMILVQLLAFIIVASGYSGAAPNSHQTRNITFLVGSPYNKASFARVDPKDTISFFF